MLLRAALAATLALMGGACSSTATMDGIMQSWEGATLDAVIAEWGYPHQEQTIAGRKLYRWFRNVSIDLPATTSGTIRPSLTGATFEATTTGGGTFHGGCTRTIEVNARNIVVGGEWSGNNCPIMDLEGFDYGRWRRR